MKTLVRLLICIVLACVCVGCAQKRVLVVSQYGDENYRVREVIEVFRKTARAENMMANVKYFNMNTISHPTETWRDEMGRMAVVRAHALEPDLIFVVGDEAARYFAQRLVGTTKRFVFLCVRGDPADYRFTTALNVIGVREEVPVQEAFAMMKELVPTARTAAVLADQGIEGDVVVAQIQKAAGTLPIRVVAVRRAGTVEEWMAAVRDLQDKADVLCIASYDTVIADPEVRNAIPAADLLSMTAEANRLPDFSFWKEAVGPKGVMAALTVPVTAQAEIAAKMAVKILFYRAKIERLRTETCTARDRILSTERAAQLGINPVLAAPPTEPEPEE